MTTKDQLLIFLLLIDLVLSYCPAAISAVIKHTVDKWAGFLLRTGEVNRLQSVHL